MNAEGEDVVINDGCWPISGFILSSVTNLPFIRVYLCFKVDEKGLLNGGYFLDYEGFDRTSISEKELEAGCLGVYLRVDGVSYYSNGTLNSKR